MGKHTDGKWTLRRDDMRERYEITAPAEDGLVFGIATIPFGFTGPFEEQQHANAALLAQAKNLFEMVRRYASECAECGGRGTVERRDVVDYVQEIYQADCRDCADIRALIAKAGG